VGDQQHCERIQRTIIRDWAFTIGYLYVKTIALDSGCEAYEHSQRSRLQGIITVRMLGYS